MVLQNYVILKEGIPTRLHFTDHEIQSREITDPLTKLPKTVRALVLTVDQLDGRAVDARYSTISEKHAMIFSPYLGDKSYKNYDFIITQVGHGFTREYQVKVERRPG